jgi:S-formylglutathione hydrolase FrmB
MLFLRRRALVIAFAAAAIVQSVAGGLTDLKAQRGFQQIDVAPAGSRVQYRTFPSKLLAREIRYGIYLPPSYAASNARFPVLYFLHGLNENEMRWSSRGRTDLTLDRMVAERRIGEFIVALPFASTSFYTNTRGGDEPWEDMIVKEFIPMIESTYRVTAARATRGISGISMGGYGALKIALKYPELFGSVSSHSAALIPDLAAASSNVSARRLDMFMGLFERIYGISRDLTYWDQNNPLTLARDTGRRLNGMKIYFDCGTEDEYGFFAGARVLADVLTRASIPHEWHLFPGNHGWDYAAQHTDESLMFHWNAFSGK